MKELIKELNQLAEEHEIYDVEDIWQTGTLLDNFINEAELLKRKNKTDSHRWYIMHEDVYGWRDMIIGVWQIGEHKSETQSSSDVGITVKFYKMKLLWM